MKKIFITLILVCLPLLAVAQININTAGSSELEEITGVGTAISGKIIDYRNTNGLFKTIEEIKNVSGIGEVTFTKMKDEITVGSNNSSSGSSDNSTDDQVVSGKSSSSDNNSAHTNETKLSDYKTETFKIGAGRERLATVRTPVLFTASQNKIGKKKNIFTWSFGDGTSAVGDKIYHTYQFSGHYNVVLNGSIDSEEDAVARTVVLVTEPKVRIATLDLIAGYVEISNDSDKEQNLNSWILRAGKKSYVIPVDTILSPKTSIKIPLQAIDLFDPEIKEIVLAYPDGGVVSVTSLSAGNNQRKVTELKKELVKVRRQIAMMSVNSELQDIDLSQGLKPEVEGVVVAKEVQNVVVLEKKLSWLGKIKNAIFK